MAKWVDVARLEDPAPPAFEALYVFPVQVMNGVVQVRDDRRE